MAGELKRLKRADKPTSLVYEADDGYPYHCMACGKGYLHQNGNFNKSPSPFYVANGGYLPWCRRCVDKTFVHFRDEIFRGDQDKAMELLCAVINTCFDKTAWDNAKRYPKNNKTVVSAYFSKLNLAQTIGASYADTVQYKEDNKVENITSVEELDKNSEVGVTVETVRRFGPGFSEVDYDSMNFEYEEWVNQYGEPEDKRQEELYKILCYLKLQLQTAIQKNDSSVSSLAKSYRDYLNSATTELEDRKREKAEAAHLPPIGMLTKAMEEYCPAEFYKDKKLFADNDGLVSYVKRFMWRPLKNLLTGSSELDKEFSLAPEEE